MRIISMKTLYESDHSSTSYAFFTAEDKVPRKIKLFLKEANCPFKVRNNTISFHFPGERYLSDTIEDYLLTEYNIPVMIYEDYDWWNIYLLFDFEKDLLKKLKPYDGIGGDHTIHVHKMRGKILLAVVIHVDYNSLYELGGSDPFQTLYEIFSEIRDNIIKGNMRDLKLIKMYCEDWDKFCNAKCETETGKKLLEILERI